MTYWAECWHDDVTEQREDFRGEDTGGDSPPDGRGHSQGEGGDQVSTTLLLKEHL